MTADKTHDRVAEASVGEKMTAQLTGAAPSNLWGGVFLADRIWGHPHSTRLRREKRNRSKGNAERVNNVERWTK
jgi:hypothetical protein